MANIFKIQIINFDSSKIVNKYAITCGILGRGDNRCNGNGGNAPKQWIVCMNDITRTYEKRNMYFCTLISDVVLYKLPAAVILRPIFIEILSSALHESICAALSK